MAVRGVRRNPEYIIDAIHKTGGIIRHAAELLECSPQTIYEWMDLDPSVALAVKEAREARERSYIDQDVEIVKETRLALLDLIKERNVTAVTFSAKTKAKFVESQPADSGPRITINIDNS